MQPANGWGWAEGHFLFRSWCSSLYSGEKHIMEWPPTLLQVATTFILIWAGYPLTELQSIPDVHEVKRWMVENASYSTHWLSNVFKYLKYARAHLTMMKGFTFY